MTLNNLIDLADVKEKQARALLAYYNGRIPPEKFQGLVDDYCNNLADSFLETHQTDLEDSNLKGLFKNYMLLINADEPHSGYRFYEALYKKMFALEKTEETEPNA